MVRVSFKNKKKYVTIDGRDYGPKSLYFHIKRMISTLKYFKNEGKRDQERQDLVKTNIKEYVKVFKENFSEEDLW